MLLFIKIIREMWYSMSDSVLCTLCLAGFLSSTALFTTKDTSENTRENEQIASEEMKRKNEH